MASIISSCGYKEDFTKEEAAEPLTYWKMPESNRRLVVVQRSLNDIEERLIRIEENMRILTNLSRGIKF